MHTTYSDGRSSPEALMREAARRGLRTVAITDHETLRGSRAARGVAKELGLELIPAIELTVSWPGYSGHGGGPDIDILGYFLEPESAAMREAEARLLEATTERAAEVCERLARQGLRLRAEDVLKTNPSYPGFVPIRDTLTRLRLAPDQTRAAALLEPVWRAAAPARLGIGAAIELVHRSGGVAVLAHPSIVHRAADGEPLSERGMAALVELGLDAVEVLHYRLSAPQRRHFALLARMFELPISGGSDEHGGPEVFARLGQEPVTPEMVAALRGRARARQAARSS